MDTLEQIVARYAGEYRQTRAELLDAPLELRMQQAYIMAARKKCLTEAVCQSMVRLLVSDGVDVTASLARKVSKQIKGINITATIARQFFNASPSVIRITGKEAEGIALKHMQQVTTLFESCLENSN